MVLFTFIVHKVGRALYPHQCSLLLILKSTLFEFEVWKYMWDLTSFISRGMKIFFRSGFFLLGLMFLDLRGRCSQRSELWRSYFLIWYNLYYIILWQLFLRPRPNLNSNHQNGKWAAPSLPHTRLGGLTDAPDGRKVMTRGWPDGRKVTRGWGTCPTVWLWRDARTGVCH